MAVATAVTFIAMMSSFVTAVVVKSLTVVLCSAVPLATPTPAVLIELLDVGIAVPVAIFQNFTVMVPASTRRLYAEMVQAKGTVT